MATTITWSIVNDGLFTMDSNGQSNVVTDVNYAVTVTDGTNTQTKTGSISIPHDTNTEFTPYSDLTEQKVIEWVKAELGSERVNSLEALMVDYLNRVVNRPPKPVRQALPWA